MPHITEEIYHNYFEEFEKDKSIAISEFPKTNKKLIEKKIEEIGDSFVSILSEVRQFKTKNQKSLTTEIKLTLDKKYKDKLKGTLDDLKAVTYSKEIIFGDKFEIEF